MTKDPAELCLPAPSPDRFGRLIQTLWMAGTDKLVNSRYGRNRASGVEWRRDDLAHDLSVATQDNHYTYDGLQQVIGHQRGDLLPDGSPPPLYSGIDPASLQQDEGFVFDKMGNWQEYDDSGQNPALDQDRSHNTANQITSITGPAGVVQPAYDGAGNMTVMPAPGGWSTQHDCTWDAWNRLVKIESGTTVINNFSYDALTRRTAKDSQEYYYDRNWRAIEERSSSSVQAQYVWSPIDRWTLIRRKRSVSGTLDEVRFALKDYLDPVAIIDSSAVVVERYGYDAFGSARIMDEDFNTLTSSGCGWNFLFHAEFLDLDNGLYNYGYRYYHPELGRWLSRDPIGERGGINIYAFVDNDGVNSVDAYGQLAFPGANPPIDYGGGAGVAPPFPGENFPRPAQGPWNEGDWGLPDLTEFIKYPCWNEANDLRGQRVCEACCNVSLSRNVLGCTSKGLAGSASCLRIANPVGAIGCLIVIQAWVISCKIKAANGHADCMEKCKCQQD